MVYLLNLVVFHSYLSLPEGMSFGEDPKVGASKGKVKESHPPIHAPNQGAQNEGRVPSGKHAKNYGQIHHFQWVNPLFLWPFSISMLNYQSVSQAACSFREMVPFPQEAARLRQFQAQGACSSHHKCRQNDCHVGM